MKKTYLFYDIESSGLSKSFDQVLQFAAIRTDLEFKELERTEFFVKLNPDTIPNPYASITHQISLAKANKEGLSEYEAMHKIHELLNAPGTISLGYNTISFDDEFLRFSFWRNLLPPYTHQFANGCSRMDVYPITVMYYLFKPDVIQWPHKADGKANMKLAALSELNELASGPAHDALVDVEATVELAKRLAKEKTMWEYCAEYFNKTIDQTRLAKLPKLFDLSHGLMVYSKLGNRDAYQAPVLGLGQHYHYKNQTLWLRLDQKNMHKLTADNIADYLQGEFSGRKNILSVLRKKYGEPGIILPPQERFMQHITEKRQEIIKANIEWCGKNLNILEIIANYCRDECYPTMQDVDVSSVLYQADFMKPAEAKLSQQFYDCADENKGEFVNKFTNHNYREMALRVVGRSCPESLSQEQKRLFEDYLSQVFTENPDEVLVDYCGERRLTVAEAKMQIDGLLKKGGLSEGQQELLQELEMFL